MQHPDVVFLLPRSIARNQCVSVAATDTPAHQAWTLSFHSPSQDGALPCRTARQPLVTLGLCAASVSVYAVAFPNGSTDR